MLYFTKRESDCVGCGACMASCPVNCISMQTDKEGFLYPVASEKCIGCSRCETICPILNITENFGEKTFEQKAICAVTNDKSLWRKSSSGGAFSEICYAFGDENTIVCGAAWDGFRVHHICAEGIQMIAPLRKSKYIESNTENVFLQIKLYLDNERSVVFCGTPCQVAGLKRFLKKPYDKLLLIDLVCHGVGSPAVFNECINIMSEQFNAEIMCYEFRAKNGSNSNKNEIYIKNDPYIQLFLSQNALRPSCGENCRFRAANRQGDLTIADFKGLAKVFPDLNCSNENYSSIIANSEKGNIVLGLLNNTMNVRKCDIEDIEKYNPLFSRQTWFSKDRDSFFKDFITDKKAAVIKWTKPAEIYKENEKIKNRLWRKLPQHIKRSIVHIIGMLKHTTLIKESEYSSCGVSKIIINRLTTKGR